MEKNEIIIKEIASGLNKFSEASRFLSSEFVKSKEDLMEIGQMANTLMNVWGNNKKLDIAHDALMGQIQVIAQKFSQNQMILENIFGERRMALHKNFEVIDYAMKNNDNEVLLQTLSEMTKIISQNPAESFKSFRQILDSDDSVLKLDF